MDNVSVRSRLRWALVAWLLLLPSTTVAGASSPVVQQIGDLRGRIAEAIAAEAVAAGATGLLAGRSDHLYRQHVRHHRNLSG